MSAGQDSSLKLPIKLDKNAIYRSYDSKVPDTNLETKLKKAMIKAFSNNNTLEKVCYEIAAAVGDAHKVAGSYKTM